MVAAEESEYERIDSESAIWGTGALKGYCDTPPLLVTSASRSPWSPLYPLIWADFTLTDWDVPILSVFAGRLCVLYNIFSQGRHFSHFFL